MPNQIKALKARFFWNLGAGLSVKQRFESRLQRWRSFRSKTWGDAPGWHESALLALNPEGCRALDPLS
jgi:hypothetical protein